MDRPSGENVGDVTAEPSVPRMTFESKSDIERIYSWPLAPYAKCEPSGEIATTPKPLPEKVCPSGRTNVDRDTGKDVERRDNHTPIARATSTRTAIAIGSARDHRDRPRDGGAVACSRPTGSLIRKRAVDMSAIRS